MKNCPSEIWSVLELISRTVTALQKWVGRETRAFQVGGIFSWGKFGPSHPRPAFLTPVKFFDWANGFCSLSPVQSGYVRSKGYDR
jgi:hypothetical protein